MKKQKRDMQATAKTLAFFVSRDGKPTSIKQAARHLKVPASRLHTRLTTLAKEGKLVRLDRGVYMDAAASAPQQSMTFGPQPDPNEELLQSLLKEREHLDAKIEKVREVIGFHKAGKK